MSFKITKILPQEVVSVMEALETIANETSYLMISSKELANKDRINQCAIGIENGALEGFKAAKGDEIIGTILLTQGELKTNKHVGWLVIAVAKKYRKKGIAKDLMETVLNSTKKELILVDCYTENTTSILLAKSFGFKELGRIPSYLKNEGVNHDVVMLGKEL